MRTRASLPQAASARVGASRKRPGMAQQAGACAASMPWTPRPRSALQRQHTLMLACRTQDGTTACIAPATQLRAPADTCATLACRDTPCHAGERYRPRTRSCWFRQACAGYDAMNVVQKPRHCLRQGPRERALHSNPEAQRHATESPELFETVTVCACSSIGQCADGLARRPSLLALFI